MDNPTATDRQFMRIALGLGKRGQGLTWPNPSVGCVLVKDKVIVGRGFTQPGGRPHAEIIALRKAGDHAKGATAYITLEPCCFQGKTPPCTDALSKAEVARVCYAITDPDPRVAGKGDKVLQSRRIATSSPCLEDLASYDHQGFILTRTHNRPKITLKLASSFDGKVATHSGDSKWITSQEARSRVHLLRAKHDAIMVGSGTALMDDPMLTSRGLGFNHNPVRIILDTHLKTPLKSNLGQTSPDIPTWIFHKYGVDNPKVKKWTSRKAKLIPCKTTNFGHLEIRDVMTMVSDLGITRVFCEGGPKLASSLFAANLVDEFICFNAGKALGGDALSSIASLGFDLVKAAPKFRLTQFYHAGGDAVSHWMPVF